MISDSLISHKRRIAIASSTRADWGLLFPVARRLAEDPSVELQVIAAGMHFDPLRGNTVGEIVADGFIPDAQIKAYPTSQSPLDITHVMADTLRQAADSFARLNPDMVVILGDRSEMLAIAAAAAALHIPIAHISGGEITQGAIDDSMRHAISKLASLHFATTEEHRQRLIAMGERPALVVNAGALGVANIMATESMTVNELAQSLGFDFPDNTAIVTYHPATNDPIDPTIRFQALLDALARRSDIVPLFTYPNNDERGSRLIAMITDYVAQHPESHAVASLGRHRYLSALRHAAVVIGNSSSGLVEAPSAGIPTVDIGCRQHRRTAGESVIHCGDSAAEISSAIDLALSPDMRARASKTVNPYYQPDTDKIIAKTLATIDLGSLLPKQFYDLHR